MVGLDDIAAAFGFDAKADADWTTLGKVTAVNQDGTLSVLLGGSATPTTCAAYCVASAGDIVFVAVSKGKARAIARQGGDGGGIALPLDVADGGTGATDAATARANLGIADPSDYIVDEGTSGIWTYRKWNSGRSECWGSISQNVNGWGSWGGLYESNQMFQATYPSSLFVETPELFAAPFGALGLAGVEFYQGASSTQTPQMYLLRGNGISGTYACKVNCYAIGRWK